MRQIRKTSLILAILGLLATLSSPTVAQNSQVKAEITRLQKSLKENPISDPDLKSLASMITDALKAAEDAANGGQLYLSLERLGQAEDLLQGARSAADKAEVDKTGLAAFEERWGKASLRLAALDKDAHAREWKDSPLTIRALAEAAQGRAIPCSKAAEDSPPQRAQKMASSMSDKPKGRLTFQSSAPR